MGTFVEYDAATVASSTDGATRVTPSFTPGGDELLVVKVTASGTVTNTATLTSSANGITFALLARATFGPTIHSVYVFVAKRRTPASPAAMTLTFDCTGDNHSGAIIHVAGITGMERVGLDAVRQHVIINDGTGGTAPVFTLPSNALTGNPTYYALAEISTGGVLTPTNWTEGAESSYSTPTIGAAYGYRNSGYTGTGPTWPGNETAHGGVFIEFDTSAAPDTRAEVERTSSSAGSYADWQWEVTFTEDVEVTRFLYFARLARTYSVSFNSTSIGSDAAGPDSDVDITLASPFFVAAGATLTIKVTPDSGASLYFRSGTGPPIVGSGADKIASWANFRAPASGAPANSSHGVLVWQTPTGGTDLTAADSAHEHTSESPTLTQVHVVAPADSAHAHTSDSPALTQVHGLAPADSAHGHTTESPTLTQVHALTPADSVHAHGSESPAVTQVHALAPGDSTHAHGAESPALTQVHVLSPADSLHAHTSDSPTVTAGAATLIPADSAHAHSSDSPVLTQVHVLTPADSAHGHTSDAASLTQRHVLMPADSAHEHTTDGATLAQVHVLTPTDSAHAHTATSPALGQVHVLVPDDTLHEHTSGSPVLNPPDLPPSRTLVVDAEDRTLTAPHQPRTTTVTESRTLIA